MTQAELTSWIDFVYNAVDKSKAGPFLLKGSNGEEVYRTAARDAFVTLLQVVVPRPAIEANTTVTGPKEDWQQ